MRPPSYKLPSPGARVGPFRVEGLLGRGGYGTVYRARWRRRDYALKFIRPESPDWKAWAERELAIHLRMHLHHPNLVRFHSCGRWPDTAEGMVYFATEYVPGQPVDRWGEASRTAREVAGLLLGISRALEVAHAAGVLHRDVKEDNILVRQADGRPVLVDFGVGTYPEAPRITRLPLPPGSWMYRTPEAVRFWQDHLGEPGSPRYRFSATDDLYPLGVISYRLLTGRTPYSPEEDRLMRELFTVVPAAPDVLNPRVPRVLSEVCMRLLAKTPEARFREAKALSAALEEALRGADAAWEVPLREGGEETEAGGTWARWRQAWREMDWTGKRARVGLAVVGLGALVAAGVGLLAAERTPPAEVLVRGLVEPVPVEREVWEVPTWAEPGQEVASPWKPPEGGEGAESPGVATPVPVASATPSKGETRMKKKVPGTQAEKERRETAPPGPMRCSPWPPPPTWPVPVPRSARSPRPRRARLVPSRP
ncbi:serine/threonine-protein kinase [Vitiosangium sp. GDMCC 1.1324]|uniref:serine/threonine protein kinase n=1 Tax=Vitiosangium sp. (strain GDMCC 1.1324) TaxID=2138576 RepID=UPI000D334F92|nr:serine/threonine-protein kinase [Vitiosangium sp. GDMCC 1.1324]PTL84588.1 hypothetical protein DAT35_05825 [Vitiosangium sp. GDMCC 1.1324]